MKYFLIIILFSFFLVNCTDYSSKKQIITESQPQGHIDSLTNDVIQKIDLPDHS